MFQHLIGTTTFILLGKHVFLSWFSHAIEMIENVGWHAPSADDVRVSGAEYEVQV